MTEQKYDESKERAAMDYNIDQQNRLKREAAKAEHTATQPGCEHDWDSWEHHFWHQGHFYLNSVSGGIRNSSVWRKRCNKCGLIQEDNRSHFIAQPDAQPDVFGRVEKIIQGVVNRLQGRNVHMQEMKFYIRDAAKAAIAACSPPVSDKQVCLSKSGESERQDVVDRVGAAIFDVLAKYSCTSGIAESVIDRAAKAAIAAMEPRTCAKSQTDSLCLTDQEAAIGSSCQQNDNVEEDQWQPIETAQKVSLPYILVYEPSDNRRPIYMVGWETDGWRIAYDGQRIKPTHWMPLPKPPNTVAAMEDASNRKDEGQFVTGKAAQPSSTKLPSEKATDIGLRAPAYKVWFLDDGKTLAYEAIWNTDSTVDETYINESGG